MKNNDLHENRAPQKNTCPTEYAGCKTVLWSSSNKKAATFVAAFNSLSHSTLALTFSSPSPT
ncbi:MAG: hypothetical protein K0Q79_2453 [Flavipsychrobacter sp.]|nr:hypothetical protein [Flavipsychrobacter sp.]